MQSYVFAWCGLHEERHCNIRLASVKQDDDIAMKGNIRSL